MYQVVAGLVATAAIVGYLYWRSTRKHLYQLASKFPTVGFPVVGVAPYIFVIKNHYDLMKIAINESEGKKFENVAGVWLGPKFLVALHNPQDIEIILSSNVHLKKSNEYKLFEPWFGNGLLISSGDTWRTHRKMIAPTFHLNVLKKFMDEFNQRADIVCKRMGQEKDSFDCHDYMSECTVETLIETVMGVKGAIQGRTCHEYAVAVMDMCDILHFRHTRVWLKPDFVFRLTKLAKEHDFLLNKILGLTNKVFKRKKDDITKNYYNALQKPKEVEKEKEKEEIPISVDANEKFSYGQSAGLKDDLDDDDVGEKKRLAFLESMIDRAQNGDGLTDQDIKNQVNTIMFEGHDTTAAGSSFFMCVMAALPEIQDKCIEEVDRIFGDSDRDVTFQDTLEMKYIERCIMETLRMFPPVPIIAREVESDLPLASDPNMIIPAGTTTVVATYKLHRREDIYENPDVFNPDNFLPEKSANRHYYSFIPFSAGPRSCVGRKYAMLKLKVILSTVLRRYRITGGNPIKDWKLQADIILKRNDGFNIKLEPRRTAKAC